MKLLILTIAFTTLTASFADSKLGVGIRTGHGSGYWLPPATSLIETKSKLHVKVHALTKVKGDDQAYWLPPASGAPAVGGKGGAGQAAPSSPYTSQYSVNPQSFYGQAAPAGKGSSLLEVKSKLKAKVKGDDQAYWLPPASGAPAVGGKGGAGQAAPSSPYTSQYSVNPQSFYGQAAPAGK
jgi:hypothetical protein